ncbi:type IV pilus biogenesis factor PilY1 [Pseudomonas matsuisoli]|uniref:Type IV pilus biogenesis factor PilY1 n=1 Tax=Pseudomonas matsuisoli TaxID=1515666 RepID=A0A917UZN6_9PSED|nr:type IV pilus biogenesis factor PilY1 [Pseudomonas matsuisoli]
MFEATSRAGELLKKDAAWRENPAGTDEAARGKIYSCRPSFHVLMTDGVWSGDGTGHKLPGESNSFGNYDNKSHTRGDNSEYSPAAPFADGVPNTLADLALYYWANDLMPGLANNVKPVINVASANPFSNPRNNPATWQHMVNYTVSFGLSAALDRNNVPWTGETYAGAGYEALLSGKATWWPLNNLGNEQINDQGKVYDLWHAAVNSRGEFFNADSPDKVVDAFAQIINRIGNYATSSTRPAVAASQTTDSTQREIYETEFSSGDWSGDVKRYNLNAAGARTLVWSAKSKLVAARTVKMASTDGTVGLQNFTWGNLNAAQRDYLNVNPFSTSQASDLLGEPRTEYIRGVRTREGTGSTDFRPRSTVLGDIVNSTPVLVKAAQYVPYLADRIDGSAGTYASFQRTVATRTPVVYVGANDGMLHGFNAETGDETFAFIPTAVFPNLSRLTGQNYKSGGHRFYVDGTPVVSDVYYDNEWHTVLIGTLRGGGRSLFALDVTNPGDVKLLWEFSHEDLGYTFATPTVARLNNGKWAVVTGNGYGNQNGSTPDKAALFVLDVKTGAQLTPDQKPLVVTGDTTKANGLSSVRLADNNSDGIADYAYAGDLQGNLWRFDLFDASTTASDTPFSSTGVSISYNAKPLFKAVDANGNAQAITAPPSLVRHPTQRGYLVIIGTGKYFEDKDAAVDTTRAQSIYAIWDRKTKGEATGGTNPPSITRSSLIEQTITSTTASGSSNPVRLLSKNVPVWYKDGTTTAQQDNDSSVRHWGWRMDLQVSTSKLGEMMISPMTARGDALIFTTLTPNDDPCKDGVTGWLYGLNPTSGARTSFNVFDFNGDGIVDSDDSVDGEVGSGYQLDYAGGHTLNGDVVFSTGENIRANFGPTSNGRQTWQLIPCDDEDNECEPSE